MAALRAGKNPSGPDGVGPNLSAKEVAAASEAAFNEFLLSGPSVDAPFDRSGPYADAIPTPKLEDFKRGAASYAEAAQHRERDEELLAAIDPKRRKSRRNSGGSFWGGIGLPGGGHQTNLTSFEPMSQSIQFAPLTLQWLTLMYSYTTYGIIQRAIDVPVYDAFRGGVEIESAGNEMDAQDIDDVSEALESWGILEAFRDGNIWARTFGGGALIFNQDGEDYRTPLDMSRIGDAPVEIYDASRWELGSESRVPVSGFYDFYGLQVHASRVMTLCGKRAPFLIRDQLAGWGLSEIQRISEDFNGYMRTKNAKFELMLEAKVDVFNIDGYKNQLASPMASQLTKRRIALINQFKSYNNALVMDKNDTYTQKQISFAGIAEMAKENRMDIAEAMQMPQSKIWGIAASGFADGEGDLESYNANVESNIREPNRPRLRRVLDMVIRAVKGGEFKFKFKYKPLRVLSSEIEEQIKKSETDRILANLNAGLLSPRQAIEWQQKKGMIPIAIDTSSFSDLPGAPVSPEQEAEEELRELGEGGAEGGERRPAATAAREPRAPAAGAARAEKGGEPPVRSYAEAGREPPPVGFQGGMGGGRTGDHRGVTGAGGGSSAVPWPGPQRQLEGADEVLGPGKPPAHPERPEQARRGGG